MILNNFIESIDHIYFLDEDDNVLSRCKVKLHENNRMSLRGPVLKTGYIYRFEIYDRSEKLLMMDEINNHPITFNQRMVHITDTIEMDSVNFVCDSPVQTDDACNRNQKDLDKTYAQQDADMKRDVVCKNCPEFRRRCGCIAQLGSLYCCNILSQLLKEISLKQYEHIWRKMKI